MKQRKLGNEIYGRAGNCPLVTLWVASVPGDGGVDWGYTSDRSKALPLNKYFAKRFAAHCNYVSTAVYRAYA